MNITLVTVSKHSCSMFKKGYKQVKIWDKKQKVLYEQKDPRLLEEVGDLNPLGGEQYHFPALAKSLQLN